MNEIKYRAYFKVKPIWTTNNMFYSSEEKFIGEFFSECKEEYDGQGAKPDFMQHMWIQDKNGKDIYDKDIVVKDGDPRHYLVTISYFGMFPFHKDQLKAVTESPHPCINFLPLLGGKKATTFEVIGNARENPELLE